MLKNSNQSSNAPSSKHSLRGQHSRAATHTHNILSTPHLITRGRTYYFRIAIPKDLRQDFPHREIKRSLRTRDIRAAKGLASAYESEVQNLFAILRVKRLTIPAPDRTHRAPTSPLLGQTTAPKSMWTRPEEAPASLFFSEAINQYVKERKQRWSPRTALEFTSTLKLLLTILGDKQLSHITRPDCVSCRDQLLNGKGRQGAGKQKPRGPKTVNQHLTLLNSVFKWSVDQGFMNRNPAERLTIPLKTRATEQRKAYSSTQLQTVLSKLPDPQGSHPERYWMPIIALYTGLRLEEIAQLRLSDLISLDGALCFNIDGTHLKTASSKRIVPVHPQLLKLGLKVHIEQTKTTECDAYLFPRLPADRFGRRGRFIGEWYGKFLRKKCEITDSKVTFHSFRHSFATALKHAGAEGPMIAELLGHTLQGQTFGRYAKEYKPSMLYAAVSKIVFDFD